jgi:hypothetical protein
MILVLSFYSLKSLRQISMSLHLDQVTSMAWQYFFIELRRVLDLQISHQHDDGLNCSLLNYNDYHVYIDSIGKLGTRRSSS